MPQIMEDRVLAVQLLPEKGIQGSLREQDRGFSVILIMEDIVDAILLVPRKGLQVARGAKGLF